MSEPLFVEAFVAVVSRHGDRIAVVGPTGESLTYDALLDRARRLASVLRDRGVSAGALVALELPKSVDTIVAILACWIVRAGFVPIDPSLPLARRKALLDDARPRVRICPEDVVAKGTIGKIAAGIPDDLAYVIYTSGSTGQPKGVRVSHRGLVPMLLHQRDRFGLDESKRVLFYLSTSFDASISDLGTTLLAGATLVIEEAAATDTPETLLASMERHRITHVDLPPALLPLLDADALPTSLETIVMGGEVCPVEVVRSFAARVRLVNVYGPTEATICTSLVVCDARTWKRPSIGAPVPGIEYAVVDDTLAPVADGTAGELLIRGRGLALGYLNRPELERAKFIETDAGRAYRTGDRVVRHIDGEWEFLGRIDRQVKLRGQLVEPEEIEARLRTHPSVIDAAVLLRPTIGDGSALVAFVVTDAEMPLGDLRSHVLEALPRWMCPSRFEPLNALPRTHVGKVDLRALETWPLSSMASHAPPLNARERELAEIFAQVLGLSEVGRDDDFFAMGGSSLDALQVLALAETRGLSVSAESLYLRPTVAMLAASSLDPSRIEGTVLIEDARRASSRVERASPKKSARDLLITGATGFLGAYVLHALLTRDDDRSIACLVRAPDEPTARRRLFSVMRRRGLSVREDDPRLRIVVGDVRRVRFGLDVASFDALAERTSEVHHFAADVNLVLPYGRLRDTNVLGAAHVRALGCDVHHASTLSVLACVSPRPRRAMEGTPLDASVDVLGGYAQSKWAAEHVLHDARTTVRFGLLTGDSRSGKSAPTCQLMTFVRGLARLGVFPEDAPTDLAIDVTPIDWAVRAHLALTERTTSDRRVFHVASPQSLLFSELLGAMRDHGLPLQAVDRASFRARMQQAEMDRTLATTVLATCRRLLEGDERHATSDLFLATGMRFDTTDADGVLGEATSARPRPDRALLRRYLDAAFEDA